jgi:NAD(P)-dependent dehydrogenase (short-subunit alcohol dehydrogenase family)
MSNKLGRKVALITGGSSGLGLATAKRFVNEGATVFITGRRQKELLAAASELGENAIPVQSDVSKLDDLTRLFETIQSRTGRLDILFANAGFADFAPLGQISEAHFDETFGINVKGTLFTVQGALALMGNGSSIIITGSMSSVQGVAAFGVCAATKAALRSFVRTWSVELRERQIRVNVVSPGTIVTPGYKHQLGLNDEQIAALVAQASAAAPLGRPGTPDEVAKAVVFLACDDSSYITGIELFVDGGTAQI